MHIVNPPEIVAEMTRLAEYDRLPDGRPNVPDDILQRMNELAVQAQGTNGAAEVSKIQVEYTALNTELGNITGAPQPGGAAVLRSPWRGRRVWWRCGECHHLLRVARQ